MTDTRTSHSIIWCKRFVLAAGIIAVGFSCCALIGWYYNIGFLRSFASSQKAMNPLTAVAVIFAGASLWLLREELSRPWMRPLGKMFAGLVTASGLVILLDRVLGWNAGIDLLLFGDTLGRIGVLPRDRMPPNTAFSLVLIGSALLLLDREIRGYRPSELLALISGFISWLAIIGYIYSIGALYGLSSEMPTALNTALALMFLSMGLLAVRPRTGLMSIVTGMSPGGVIARRFLPAIALIPIIIGGIRVLSGRFGFYHMSVGAAIMTVTMAVIAAGLVCWNVMLLNRADADRRRVEEALRNSERSTRLILESAHDAYVAMDASGMILDWNRAAVSTFGWSREEAVGRPLATTIIPPRYREAHERGFNRFLATGEGPLLNKRIEIAALHRDGHEFPVELTISPIRRGESMVFNSFIHDISNRKLAEEKLRLSEEPFRLLVEGVKDYAIIMLDTDGCIASWNAGAQRIKGYQPEEILGEHFSRFYRKEDIAHGKPERALAAAATDGRFEDEDLRVRKDGTLFWASVIIRPLLNRDGSLRGYCKVIRDLTERKRAEEQAQFAQEQLRHKERLASIGTLAAGIAHEINNPVGSILLAAQNALEMMKEQDGHEVTERALTRIVNNSDRCAKIVRSVLQFSRREMTEKWLNDLNTVVERAVELTRPYAQQRGAIIEMDLGEGLPEAIFNPIEIEQVFMNLIRNAIEAGKGGTRIRVTTDCAGDNIFGIVQDNGRGMDYDQKQHLFDPFFTTRQHQGGTGLGMSIVHGIVEAHGGNIEVQSHPGFGTTITIHIPLKVSVPERKAIHGESISC